MILFHSKIEDYEKKETEFTAKKQKGDYVNDAHLKTAEDAVAKAKEAGIVMTSAGAPFPYGIDPKDSVIRIAPTFPNLEEMQQAAEVFACCVKLVSVEKLLDGRRA